MADIDTIKVNSTTYNIKDSEALALYPNLEEKIEEMIEEKGIQLGLRVNFRNNTFTRLGAAVGRNGGSDFDNFPMYKRRRCNLTDVGVVSAYLGDANYTTDGSNGQVMVEQPAFYYKVVVPEQSETDKWISYPNSPKEIEYWICNKPLTGYKLHPAFWSFSSAEQIDYFYEGAYEGYVNNNTLCSISGVAPSSDSSSYTRSNFRTYATNRGLGWCQETIWSMSADQLLMAIEYGGFNMQAAIGFGNVKGSGKINTGTLNSYENGSYGDLVNKTNAVQWRGKENPWGNIYKWMDGFNINNRIPYIALYPGVIADDTTTGYTALSFNASSTSGYISAFGYDPDFDWALIPIEADSTYGTSATPVGDRIETSTNWRVVRMGGYYDSNLYAGPFYYGLTASSSYSNAMVGGRLIYIESSYHT